MTESDSPTRFATVPKRHARARHAFRTESARLGTIDTHPQRWLVAWTGFAVLAVCGGLHFYIFPVVMAAMQEDLNVSLTAITGTIFVWGVAGAAVSPAMGAALDRWGPRRVVFAGTLLQAAAFGIVGSATSIIAVYFGFALAAVALCANTYIAISAAVTGLFEKQRGQAMGVAMLGLGVGGLVLPNVTQQLLGLGWQKVYWIYAGLALLMLPFIWIGLRAADGPARGEADAAAQDDGQNGPAALLRTRSFWGLALGDGLTGLIFSFFTVHFVAIATETGITATTAALFFGVFLFLSSPGTIALGVLADRFSVRPLTLICYGLPVLLVPALFGLPNLVFLGLFALVPGFLAGGRAAIFPLAIGYSFGVRHVARAYGWLNVAFLFGAAVGPMLSGVLHDRSGNYTSSIWVSWGLGIASVALVALIRPERGWSEEPAEGDVAS